MAKRKYNNKNYTHYVIDSVHKKIDSGWEYLEDAKDALKDAKDEKRVVNGKILTKRGLGMFGIDPENDDFWGNALSAAAKKTPCLSRWDPEGDHANGYRCSLPKGHRGDHEAHDTMGEWIHGWGKSEGMTVKSSASPMSVRQYVNKVQDLRSDDAPVDDYLDLVADDADDLKLREAKLDASARKRVAAALMAAADALDPK